MHGLFEGVGRGSGVSTQVQLPNPLNQNLDALKRLVHSLKLDTDANF